MVPLYVATPQILARYGITTDQIRAGADIITARTDLAGLQLFNPMNRPNATQRGNEFTNPNIQVLHGLPAGGTHSLFPVHDLRVGRPGRERSPRAPVSQRDRS